MKKSQYLLAISALRDLQSSQCSNVCMYFKCETYEIPHSRTTKINWLFPQYRRPKILASGARSLQEFQCWKFGWSCALLNIAHCSMIWLLFNIENWSKIQKPTFDVESWKKCFVWYLHNEVYYLWILEGTIFCYDPTSLSFDPGGRRSFLNALSTLNVVIN